MNVTALQHSRPYRREAVGAFFRSRLQEPGTGYATMKTINQLVDKLRRESMTPEQKARMAEANVKWRLANAEQVRKINRDYYLKNKVWIAAKNKARYNARKTNNMKKAHL